MLLLCFFFVSERCLINANVSRYNFTQHYPLYECRLLAVDYPLLPFIRLHARTHTSHAMPKCVYKMQFLSSFLFCPNSVCNLNSIGLYCIAIFLLVFTVLLFPFHALKCFMCFFLFYMIVIIIVIIIVINICVCVLLLNGKIHAAFAKRACSV